MKDLAVVLHTCDAYERLWPGWLYCWKKFQTGTDLWNTKLYFVNEEKMPPNLSIYTYDLPSLAKWRPTGKGEWSDRLLKALSNIPEPYILYMQEDFWLKDRLSNSALRLIMDYISHGDAVRIMGCGSKLMKTLHPPQPAFKSTSLGIRVKKEALRRFYLDSPYFFGHAATIWYKPHLIKCLGPGENPWINCARGNERCKLMEPPPIHYHYPFEWYEAVHANVKRIPAWKDAKGDRSLPGRLTSYGMHILQEMGVDLTPFLHPNSEDVS
jgi:hypothetical protein